MLLSFHQTSSAWWCQPLQQVLPTSRPSLRQQQRCWETELEDRKFQWHSASQTTSWLESAKRVNNMLLLSFYSENVLKMMYTTRLPPGPTRLKNWNHSKFLLILATFGLLVPKLCSDKSESGGKWILVSHWLISSILRILNQWENRIYFSPLSLSLTKYS